MMPTYELYEHLSVYINHAGGNCVEKQGNITMCSKRKSTCGVEFQSATTEVLWL